MSDDAQSGGGALQRKPSGTVLATWRDNGSIAMCTHHRLVVGGAGDEFLIFHQTRLNSSSATWSTKDTWEAGEFPDILPEEDADD